MAKIKQGILGGFSGKVANVVGSSWKGIAIIKSLPLSVANPQTAAQVAQRLKMTNVVAFSKEILATVIKPLRDRFAVRQSGYNTFVSDNIALFATALPTTFADLEIASGKMASTAIGNLVGAAAQATVEATWTDDQGTGFKLAGDEAYLVCINETNGEIASVGAATTREDESAIATFDSNLTALDDVHAYLNFLRADGTVVSDTSYMTDTVPMV